MRPELKFPSAGKQGVRCGLNPMYGCHLSTSLEECYYHKWNLWFLYRLEDTCFFYSFLKNLFSSPLMASVVWARRYSDLGFQISLPNYSLYKKNPEVPKLSVSGQHAKLGQSPVESKCKVFTRGGNNMVQDCRLSSMHLELQTRIWWGYFVNTWSCPSASSLN